MKKNFLGLFIAIFVLFIPTIVYADSTAERIHFISSDNGDSMIIESNGHYGLIDALDQTEAIKVKNYADALGVQKFDFVIMTHNHEDHIGGIPELADYFDSNTIVFYKEDLTVSDDYEEITLGLHNHQKYLAAIQTFANKSSKTCDVTKASSTSDAACNLSTLTNSTISEVSYDLNDNFVYDYPYSTQYATKTRENLSFSFGNFNITLYSLYTISYHHENLNSIVTKVDLMSAGSEEEDPEVLFTAVLTGDVETALDDSQYPETASSSNIITNPTKYNDVTCNECTSLGLENQIADVIEHADLLKASNHGSNTSNSLYSIYRYAPQYYVITGNGTGGEPYDNNVIPMVYLKANGTPTYLASETAGALVAEFDETTGITMKEYSASAVATDTELHDASNETFTNGWKQLYNGNINDKVFAYVENGAALISQWKDIEKNSVEHRYYFDETGIMATGFLVEILDTGSETEPIENPQYHTDYRTFYMCESSSCLGEMQTGFQTIDGYKYYFRTTEDEISEGVVGEMVIDEAEINGITYYFRKEDDEVFAGPQGSALTNGCVNISGTVKCFDSNGEYTTNPISTPVPTNALCNGAEYNGEEQSITSAPIGGYTWEDNLQTAAGNYTVTARINEGYVWDDNSTDEVKTIQCSMAKAQLEKPTLLSASYMYTGDEVTPTFDDYSEWGIVETYEDANHNPVTSPINVGTYYAKLNLLDTNNMEWSYEDEETGQTVISTSEISYEWAITTATRPAPSASSRTYQYDGNEHSIDASTGSGVLEYSLTGLANDWSTTKPGITDVGTLLIHVRVKADLNYTASEEVTATVTIIKRELPRPIIVGNSFEYTGSVITPTISNYDSELMTVTGTTSATNVGVYTVRVNIKDDQTIRKNYKWGSGEDYSESVLPWEITKATKGIPSVTSCNEQEYDGNPHEITINSSDAVEYSLDALTWSDTVPTRTNVGTTYLHVRAKGDDNYEPSGAIDAIINIVPKKLNKPTLVTSSFNYTGSAITPEINGYDSNIMTISGDTSATAVNQYTISIGLKPILNTDPAEYNYEWMDDTTSDVSLVWEIIKDKYPAPTVVNYSGVYDGNSHTITVTSEGTFKYSTDNTNWVDTVPSRTDAGTTTVYVKRLGDSSYEDSYSTLGTITISKANIESPTVENYMGNYDGSSHTITVSNIPSLGTLKYSTDNYNWSTTKPTRTSLGTTTVYVKVFGDTNHNNSSTITATITIIDGTTYEIKNYPVDESNKYISKIAVGTDLETFKANITLGSGYSVSVDTKIVNGKKVLYTGGKTKIMQGLTVVKEYTNIVVGDPSGDGKVNYLDYVKVYNHIQKTKDSSYNGNLLTGPYLIAADMSNDNAITYLDYVKIYNKIQELKGGIE